MSIFPEAVDSKFILWMGVRAVLHRGWWLVTSLYLVTVAHLDPAQLVLIGVMQGAVSLIFEIPAGVVADTISRKKALVLSQVLMGTAMLATATVTDFSLILATQMLWGISWTFASGSDVAWVTDELRQPERISRVLTKAARSELAGSAIGIVCIGLFAAATSFQTAMISAGVLMVVLGIYVALRFPEHNFKPEPGNRWAASLQIFKDGINLISKSRLILIMFLATILVNGAAEAGRLYPKRFDEIGFPAFGEPVVWLTAVSIASLAVGFVALRIVEPRVHGIKTARRDYALACLIGVLGFVLLAVIPNIWVAFAAVMLVHGISSSLTRTLAAIQVNRATTDNVRATVHSFLSQAEYFGEVVFGLLIVLLATKSSVAAFVGGAILLLITALLMRSNHRRLQIVDEV